MISFFKSFSERISLLTECNASIQTYGLTRLHLNCSLSVRDFRESDKSLTLRLFSHSFFSCVARQGMGKGDKISHTHTYTVYSMTCLTECESFHASQKNGREKVSPQILCSGSPATAQQSHITSPVPPNSLIRVVRAVYFRVSEHQTDHCNKRRRGAGEGSNFETPFAPHFHPFLIS